MNEINEKKIVSDKYNSGFSILIYSDKVVTTKLRSDIFSAELL